MNNLRKAAEMALKVLEEINEISKPPTGIPLPAEIDNAMETLRQALAQREWVGLSEEDAIELLLVNEWEIESTLDFAKAIEQALKDKNT